MRAIVLRLATFLLLAAGAAAQPAAAQATQGEALRFGILPTGGPAESRQDWQGVLDDLSRTLGRPVRAVSVSSYEGMHRAIKEGQVDVAFLSGKLALDTVLENDMSVVARVERIDGAHGYRSVLVARRDGAVPDLASVLKQPRRWRFARGEELSVSGYMVPEVQLFAKQGIDSGRAFRSVTIDSHENNALAVVNGEVDLATNNTADLARFANRFPREHAQLKILWRSEEIPHAVLVASNRLGDQARTAIGYFLTAYGRGSDHAAQRRNLRRIHGLAGFAPADDTALLPFAEIAHALEKRELDAATGLDAATRKARLAQLDRDYARTRTRLQAKKAR